MDVFEAIRTRRSIGKVKPDEIPRDLVKKILEAGIWAPNHHLTEPWKFFVITGDARHRLGEAMSDALKDELGDPDSPESKVKLEAEQTRPLRAPVIIALAVSPSSSPNVDEMEEYTAVAAASQNMLLVAHALGLGSILRTGRAVYRKKVKEFFGLKGRERLFGFIYIGYSASPPPEGRRTPFAEKTKWLK